MAELVAGRYEVVECIWGHTEYEVLARARGRDGGRYLVSVVGHYEPRIARVNATIATYKSDRVARVVELFRHDNLDILVELEPPGRPSPEVPPLSFARAKTLALAFGRMLLDHPPGTFRIEPQLVYLDGDTFSIAPGFTMMEAHRNPTLTGGLPLRPMVWMSSEQVRGMRPLTRAHDAFVAANLLRFWLTASPLYGGQENYMQLLVDMVMGKHLFHYDGPLHEAIDAGIAGSLEGMLELLERTDVTAADASRATRAALIADIVAHPDDDAPRLVLADYLLERGDPRGDLIQLQCRGQSADELLAQHGTAWSAYLRPDIHEAFFERGFVARVRGADHEMLARRRDALLAFGPLPRSD